MNTKHLKELNEQAIEMLEHIEYYGRQIDEIREFAYKFPSLVNFNTRAKHNLEICTACRQRWIERYKKKVAEIGKEAGESGGKGITECRYMSDFLRINNTKLI